MDVGDEIDYIICSCLIPPCNHLKALMRAGERDVWAAPPNIVLRRGLYFCNRSQGTVPIFAAQWAFIVKQTFSPQKWDCPPCTAKGAGGL